MVFNLDTQDSQVPCRAVPFVEREEEYHEMSAAIVFTLGHCGTVGILAGCVNKGVDCAAMFLKKEKLRYNLGFALHVY